MGFLFPNNINTDLVINTAENNEQMIPALNVTAKPLIGPDPIQARTNAAMRVVTFASKIVVKALP